MSGEALVFLILLVVPLLFLMGGLVAKDMDARGHDGRVYGLLTIVVLPVGLVVWLARRRTRGPGSPTAVPPRPRAPS